MSLLTLVFRLKTENWGLGEKGEGIEKFKLVATK